VNSNPKSKAGGTVTGGARPYSGGGEQNKGVQGDERYGNVFWTTGREQVVKNRHKTKGSDAQKSNRQKKKKKTGDWKFWKKGNVFKGGLFPTRTN